MTLLDGNIDRKSYSDNSKVSLVSLSDTVDVKGYTLKIEQDARQAVVVGSAVDLTGTETAATKTITAAQAGTININGVSVTVAEGDTYDEVFTKLRNAGDSVGVSVFAKDATDPASTTDNLDLAGYTSTSLGVDTSLVFVSGEYGSSESITLYCDNADLADAFGLASSEVKATGYDAKASINGGFNNTATVSISGNKLTVSDRNNFEMVIKIEPGTVETVFDDQTTDPLVTPDAPSGSLETDVNISVLDAGQMDLQIGANEGQTMSVTIPKVDPSTLGIDKVNIGTAEGAQAAITLLDEAINMVSSIRSKLGAYQNRLEHSISNLDTTSENMTESLSRISDVDMAEEMAQYTQMNVLAQAGTSMLSQANQRPQTILSLLQQ
jgi:flagellin